MSMTILVAGVSLFDSVQAMDLIAQRFDIPYFAEAAQIAAWIGAVTFLWYVTRVVFLMTAWLCTAAASIMDAFVRSVANWFWRRVCRVTAKVWKWANGKKK